ncbi:hypothetical protein [Virgibacillus proomii]|uniref:hypothetical protein n=1 Tax=Virgibacillus proomii TaxID=84407 RepID=UPI001C10D326|nr:hypothetical protein [Virgibacillus proomii]MBU5266258.1 hypothetical protein [Virgibacillus proomii]
MRMTTDNRIETLRKIYADQRREFNEIKRKQEDLLERRVELDKKEREVLRGIMDTEIMLERFGIMAEKDYEANLRKGSRNAEKERG